MSHGTQAFRLHKPENNCRRCPFESIGAKPQSDARRHRIWLAKNDKEFIVDMGPPIGGVVVGGGLQLQFLG
jgi:hypothetical protein